MQSIAESDWEVLRRVPLFAGLEREALKTLLGPANLKSYGAGSVLFLQDDPADRFFAIMSGWVKLWRETPAGGETVVGVFSRGDTFAEAAIFDSRRYPVNAEVVEPARILVVPAEPFLRALRDDCELALRMLGSMSRHMRGLVAQLEQVQAKSAPQRVAGFLLRLQHDGTQPNAIRLPYDKSLLAARLGMRPETFSRALSKLRGLGVEAQGALVSVPDPASLRRFCEEDA